MPSERFPWAAGWAVVLLAAMAIVLLLWAAGAVAHEAPKAGCAKVPGQDLQRFEGGYLLTVRPGDHPMVPPHEGVVTHMVRHGDKRLRRSDDGKTYACLSPGGGFILYRLAVPVDGI